MTSLFFTKTANQLPIIEFPAANLTLEEAKTTAETIWNQTLHLVAFEINGVRTYLN